MFVCGALSLTLLTISRVLGIVFPKVAEFLTHNRWVIFIIIFLRKVLILFCKKGTLFALHRWMHCIYRVIDSASFPRAILKGIHSMTVNIPDSNGFFILLGLSFISVPLTLIGLYMYKGSDKHDVNDISGPGIYSR